MASGSLCGGLFGYTYPVLAALKDSFCISSLRISGGMLAMKSGSRPI